MKRRDFLTKVAPAVAAVSGTMVFQCHKNPAETSQFDPVLPWPKSANAVIREILEKFPELEHFDFVTDKIETICDASWHLDKKEADDCPWGKEVWFAQMGLAHVERAFQLIAEQKWSVAAPKVWVDVSPIGLKEICKDGKCFWAYEQTILMHIYALRV